MGRLVLSYPELVLTFAHCVGLSLGLKYEFLSSIRGIQSETKQIEIGVGIASSAMDRLGHSDIFMEIVSSLKLCSKIRNHYAHGSLSDYQNHLFIVDLRLADLATDYWLDEVTFPLLQEQAAFYEYTRRCLLFLESRLSQIGAFRDPPRPLARPTIYARRVRHSDLKDFLYNKAEGDG
jgi:hypothetical protein